MINNNIFLERLFNYAKKYEQYKELPELKTIHMLAVTQNINKLALELKLDGRMRNLAYITGLFHDIGRFEQIKIYKTFRDDQSTDHAELSAEVLLSEGFIDELPQPDQQMIVTAIRNHNKLDIEAGLDFETLLLSKMIRDADKADIYRVIYNNGIEQSYSLTTAQLEHSRISEKIRDAVFEHRTANIADRTQPLDFPITALAMIFDINFPETLKIIHQSGYYLCKLNTLNIEDHETHKLYIWNTGLKSFFDTGRFVPWLCIISKKRIPSWREFFR